MNDLLQQAKDDYKTCEEIWRPRRERWLAVQRFRMGNHWPDKIKAEREAAGRPVVVVDKTEQHVRQVVNDGRQNRPAPKVSPVDSDGDPKVAEAYRGMIRSICNKSNADEAYDTSLDHAAGNGYGFFRLITEYEHDKTFNQEIKVRRIADPMLCMIGPHQLADGSDTRMGFYEEMVPKTIFKKKWPKAKVTDWSSATFADGWTTEHDVRVCEYFYQVEEPIELHLLADGTTATDQEYQTSLQGLQPGMAPVEIVNTRTIPAVRVKWCRLTAAEILEENDWGGTYIPLIPVYGVEKVLNGKTIYDGMVWPAMDAQRMYDFARAGFAEHVSLSTRVPWIAAAGQLEGFESEWARSNTENVMVLHYNPIDVNGTPVPPPQRSPGSSVPSGLAQDMQVSQNDIEGAMGRYAASVGKRGNATSGVQERAQIQEGDTGSFHYQDNLNRAIKYLTRQLVDLIPKYTDSKRVIRMLGDDGVASMAMHDPDQEQPVVKQGAMTIYNLNAGRYDVEVEAGPSYTTRRQEAAAGMTEMLRANPQAWVTHGDLYAKAQDWPDSEQFAKRSKLAMPPELRQAIEAEEQETNETPEVRAVVQQANEAIQQRDEQIQAAEQGIAERDQELQRLQRELEDLKKQSEIKAREVSVKEYEAETERIQALAPAVAPDQVSMIVQQTVREIMAQPVPMQSDDMNGMGQMMPSGDQPMPMMQPQQGA